MDGFDIVTCVERAVMTNIMQLHWIRDGTSTHNANAPHMNVVDDVE